MARPQFRIAWELEDSADALKARYRRAERADQRLRLHGLWLLREGRSVLETAAVIGVHRRTVDRWVGWYRTGGLPAVLAHQQGGDGRARLLAPEHEAQLAREVVTGRFRTAAEVGQWVTATFAVTLRPRTCYGVLARLRCAPKVPRPQHDKAFPQMQEDWKKGGLLTP